MLVEKMKCFVLANVFYKQHEKKLHWSLNFTRFKKRRYLVETKQLLL